MDLAGPPSLSRPLPVTPSLFQPLPATPESLGLFDATLARGDARTAVSDRAWVAALLAVEAALAQAAADEGLIPADAAVPIADACAALAGLSGPSPLDIAALAADAGPHGNPVVPLVDRLREAVGPEFADYVHFGATSQDIMDSAEMLVAYRALTPILDDLHAAADRAAELARTHRDTPMAGRTLLQQAVPITFGLKAAGWMAGLDEVADRLTEVRETRLAAQLGGAAGTRAGYGGAGARIADRLADQLGLAETVLPWHTIRTRPAQLAAALGEAAGVIGKVARDVILLAQNEVAEVAEGHPGGSSTMAHKRNPVATVSAAACAAQAPGLVATILAAMAQEHERAAGAWHAQWRPGRELLIATGSAAAWLRAGLAELRVDPARMRSNLDSLLTTLGTTEPDVGEASTMVDAALAGRSR